jgi:hypothetical protein
VTDQKAQAMDDEAMEHALALVETPECDAILLAFDMLGWRLVPKEQAPYPGPCKWPLNGPTDYLPDWCEAAE